MQLYVSQLMFTLFKPLVLMMWIVCGHIHIYDTYIRQRENIFIKLLHTHTVRKVRSPSV